MKAAASKDMIDVDALCVGMFVHLDLGWMSHPFPLGNFKITDATQIATIRSLGLREIRWNPEQSDVAAPGVKQVQAVEPVSAVTITTLTETPEALARREHREQLERQREGLALCERQFAEAAQDCKLLTERAAQHPQDSRAQAEALARALVDKMLVEGDLCIRLLSNAAGDKASTHALNVTVISLLMGRTFGLDEADMLDLGVGSLLHDIGKLELPDRVRHREEHLSSAELRLYEEHVARGVVLGRKMGLSSGASLVLAQHHEHADGSGFPLRLNTDRMTAAARIVSLVNRYDNLCNPNLPTHAITPHEALSLLFAQGKTKFDTAILGAFIKMMGVYPAGSTVQLTDDRFAMVVGVNSSRPLKPRVMVHEPRVPRDEALIVDLQSLHGVGIRRSIKPQQLPIASLEYLAPRPRVSYFFEPLHSTESAPSLQEAEAVQ